ncbi:MAG: caspase family protein [Cyclobacteriaceae bacterium]|nr:caspase family protein [Cyclobacteriaceae bacterium]MCH8516523.1 caspase family protein [Cyclobacteriaceae bacterium]
MNKTLLSIIIIFSVFTLKAQNSGSWFHPNAHQQLISEIDVSPRFDVVASTSLDGTIKLWNLKSGVEDETFPLGNFKVFSLAYDPLDDFMAYGNDRYEVVLLDAQRRAVNQRLKGHGRNITNVAYSPDGKHIASVGQDSKLIVWELDSYKKIHDWVHINPLLALAWHPNNTEIVVGGNGKKIHVYDIGEGQRTRIYYGHQGRITSLAYSADGKILASGGTDRKLLLWDVETGDFIHRFDDHNAIINSIAFDPASMFLATVSNDKMLRIYDAEKQLLLAERDLGMGELTAVTFSPHNPMILVGSAKGGLRALSIDQVIKGSIDSQDFVRPSQPIQLSVENITFSNQHGQPYIEGKEKGILSFDLVNASREAAQGMHVSLQQLNNINGLSFDKMLQIGRVPANERKKIEIPFYANEQLPEGSANFVLSFEEAFGFEPSPIEVSIRLREFRSPDVQIVDYSFTNERGGALELGSTASLQMIIQNLGQGNADSVRFATKLPDNIFPASETNFFIGSLGPGQSREVRFDFFTNRRYSQPEIEIGIELQEKFKQYAQPIVAKAAVNQELAARRSISFGDNIQNREDIKISKAQIYSAVDRNIPQSANIFHNRYALVIGNEDYSSVSRNAGDVPYAAHDARIFALYAHHTLGIPKDQVFLSINATAGEMRREINLLQNIIKQLDGRAEVFVFYAGHGYPDPASEKAYLMPVDAAPGFLESTAIGLSDFYQSLSKYPSQNVTVFLDACFSGGAREEPLVAARNVRIEPKSDFVPENLVVFSASQGDQQAFAYDEEGHGLFTFFLLQKLQETKGQIDYSGMASFLRERVSLRALKLHRNVQNPNILYGPAVEDAWGEFRFLY